MNSGQEESERFPAALQGRPGEDGGSCRSSWEDAGEAESLLQEAAVLDGSLQTYFTFARL